MNFNTKTLIGSLILATAMPVAMPATASAQSREELRRDRQDVREEQRELRDAQRFGDRRDVREERRDVREARQEYREDLRDYRDYRATNRRAFRATPFRTTHRYQAFRPGVRINPGYYAPRYTMNNYRDFRLPRPGPRQAWVRNYDDLLLVNTRSGVVMRVIRNFYW